MKRSGLSVGAQVVVTPEKPVAGGRMLARHEGQVLLVGGAIPGEVVRVGLERVGRGVAYAQVTEVLERHADRRSPPVDRACGGNAYAHIRYERQLTLKSAMLGDTFARIGQQALPGIVEVTASPECGYRMRARLRVIQGQVGFLREGTHRLCDARASGQLLPETSNVIDALADRLGATSRSAMTGVQIAENLEADQRVCHLEVESRPAVPDLDAIASVEGLTGVTCSLPGARGIRQVTGLPWVSDPVSSLVPTAPDGPRLRRQARSFFQGNRFLLRAMVVHVSDTIPEGTIVDLYAGVGLFAVALAALGRGGIVAVEGDRACVEDLQANATPFGDCLRVVGTSVERYLAGRTGSTPTSVIVDPPRTGLSREAVEAVAVMAPPRVVYVSCDAPTLARDVRRLRDAGYELRELRAFDLFPNTPHVEAVAVLER